MTNQAKAQSKAAQCDPLARVGPAGARVLLQLLEPDPGGEGYVKVYAYGLSKKAKVTYLTALLTLRALQAAGYVEELSGSTVERGPGRPRRYYRLVPKAAPLVREAVSRVLMKADSRAKHELSARIASRVAS